MNYEELRIMHRPEQIEMRQWPGHWEGDLIKGAFNRSCVGTLVERKTRFVVLCRMDGCTAQDALEGFTRQMKKLPAFLRQSLTYDRGTEMTCHVELAKQLNLDIWFADPHAPWQRGSNENTNGLLRKFLPKGTDLSTATQTQLNDIANLLNGRPRQTLGWDTPEEAMAKELEQSDLAKRCTWLLRPPGPVENIIGQRRLGVCMRINEIELQVLRNRWRDGKYRAVREALERVSPQAEWMDLCDVIDHPAAKRLANDLRGLELREKDLQNLDLGDSFLDFSAFDRSKFDGAQFQWSIMNGTSFRECKFRLTQMIIVFGEEVDFRGSVFEGAYIDHAQMKKTNFSTVVMQGGTMSNSNVEYSDFSGMLFMNGAFGSNDARCCNFSGARFVECDFSASRLNAGRLVGTSFENCNLTGVDFRGVNLEGAVFRGGSFWSLPEGSAMDRTKFDDTPEARRAIEMSTTVRKDCVEWCPLTPEVDRVAASVASVRRLKGRPAEVVPQSGWWVSPALGGKQGRCYFKAGEKFPDIKSTTWGLVIWSYDPADQS